MIGSAPSRAPFGLLVLLFVLASLSLGSLQAAERVTLGWNRNPEPDVIGYRLHFGTSSGRYTTSIDVGNVTRYVLEGLTGGTTYYSVITAYNTAGLESFPSNEISFDPTPITVLPTLSYQVPGDHESLVEPATLVLYSSVSQSNAELQSVEFYLGSTKLGEATQAPWSFIRRSLPAGEHVFSAVAIFKDGSSLSSAPLAVSVAEPTDDRPTPTTTVESKLQAISIRTIAGSTSDDSFLVFVSGREGKLFEIQSSEDLLHWEPLGSVRIKDGYSYFIDPGSLRATQRRYYRVVGE